MEAPRITIYYRYLNNIDGKPLTTFTEFTKNADIHYGDINAALGGESQYIIEFDIWNNEPAFAAGMYIDRVHNAEKCVFSVWNDKDKIASNEITIGNDYTKSFMYARCFYNKNDKEFKPIAGTKGISNELVGNILPDTVGVLSGQPGGDHTIIQTKIIVPPGVTKANYFNFVFSFDYEY